jgi:dipeptidyl-peptidase-3
VDAGAKLGPVYSALEDCRADAVVLFLFMDPKLVEIGAVKAEEHTEAAKAMFQVVLTGQLRKNGAMEGDTVRQAHERGGQALLTYLTQPDKDFGLAVVQKDGKHLVQITDVAKAREGVKEILIKLQTFKSMGDGEAAAAFFEQWGTKINKAWQADVKARLEALALPKETAFVFPKLVPVLGESKVAKVTEGEETRKVVQDVTLETGESFADQQLRFKRLAKSREVEAK